MDRCCGMKGSGKMKTFGSKVRLRFILICILLGTLPAVVVGVFSYYRASRTVQEKVDEGNMQILNQVKMSVEQLLLTADRMLLQFLESPTVKASLNTDMSGREFQTFNNIESLMNNLPSADLGTDGVSLANFNKGWVITVQGIYKLDDFERKDEFLQYLKTPGSSFWIDRLSLEGRGPEDRPAGMHGVSLIKKTPIFMTDSAVVAVMNISHSRLSELISENRRPGEVMVIGESGCIIAHNDKAMWGKDISSYGHVERLSESGQTAGNFNMEVGGVACSVSYIKSDYNGWVYLSATPLRSVTQDSKSIGWFTLVTCLVTILLVNLAAYIVSGRFYRPIGQVYKLVMGIQEAPFQTKKQDELALIEERVNFLLRDQARLKKQVYSQLEQLKEFFLLRLIIGELDGSTIESRLKLFNYPPLPASSCVFVIRTDTLEGTRYREDDRDLMLFAVNNVIGELLEDVIVLKPAVIEENQVTIIGSGELSGGDFKDYAYSVAEKVQRVIRKVLSFTISVGISRPLAHYRDIHRGYLEGLEALKHQLTLGYNAIIFVEDVQVNKGLKPVFPINLENELLAAVKACDAERAKEILHQFVERIFGIEVDRYEYQLSLTRLLTDLVFTLKEMGEAHNILIRNGKSVFEQLYGLKTAGEIENWLNASVVSPIIGCLEAAGGNQYKKIVADTLSIIHSEYDTDLTLEKCAAMLNYHPSYIRRILKREAGLVFSDYLSQYRLDMAKKWLIETDMKVSEIAEKLKYRNPENFIRCFKRTTGITPGQYRESKL